MLAEPGGAQLGSSSVLLHVSNILSGVSGLPWTWSFPRDGRSARRPAETRKASWGIRSDPACSLSYLILLTQASHRSKPNIEGWEAVFTSLRGGTARSLGKSGNPGMRKESGPMLCSTIVPMLVKNMSTHSLILLAKGRALEGGLGFLTFFL